MFEECRIISSRDRGQDTSSLIVMLYIVYESMNIFIVVHCAAERARFLNNTHSLVPLPFEYEKLGVSIPRTRFSLVNQT